jgi:hypothetical protein
MSTRAATKLPGVIDTLSAGYQTVNHHPWLILLPLVLNLFTWLGPRLSPLPLVRSLVQFMEESMNTAQGLGVSTPEMTQTMQLMKKTLEGDSNDWNLFAVLSANNPLGVPSLVLPHIIFSRFI